MHDDHVHATLRREADKLQITGISTIEGSERIAIRADSPYTYIQFIVPPDWPAKIGGTIQVDIRFDT